MNRSSSVEFDVARRCMVLVGLVMLLPSPAFSNPPLANGSFEIQGPTGPVTMHTPPTPGGAGVSAADSWGVFHNTAGGPNTTTTQLVPTTLPVPGAGARMIHVQTDGQLNGLTQVTGPAGSGSMLCTVSVWIYVNAGTVVIGAGNPSNTQATSAQTAGIGTWEYLQTENLDSPCNLIVIYSLGGGADFYVENARVMEHQQWSLTTPLEYSNALDEQSVPGGGDHGGLDPGQILYTEPLDDPANTLPVDVVDFFPLVESGDEPDSQVDALAHGADAFFDDVVEDAARLLISIEGDPGAADPTAVFYEDTDGSTGIQYSQRNLNEPNLPSRLDDLDAMELWRVRADPNLDDSAFYSLEGDGLGVSVWHEIYSSPDVYLTQPEIWSAVSSLGFSGEAVEVDVDALMVKDTGGLGQWDQGDEILFSIRAAGGWTGGEIVHWRYATPASFLIHGGHVWDTSFSLAPTFPVSVSDQEVDAIESLPEPGLGISWLCGFAGVVLLARRRERERRR